MIMPRYAKILKYFKAIKNTEALEIGISLLSKLELLHSTGFVHNDIKPSNVMLDYNNKVQLIDFGCASTFL